MNKSQNNEVWEKELIEFVISDFDELIEIMQFVDEVTFKEPKEKTREIMLSIQDKRS